MKNRYLTGNPLPWLLDKSNSSIRYLTMRDIIEDNTNNEYNNIIDSKEIKSLLKVNKNGILGDIKNFDIYYKGTMWYFAEAVEWGLDKRIEIIHKTADFIINTYQLSSGGFTLNWKPEIEAACRTGDMLKYLIMAGLNDNRIAKGINWIINNQRHDGGWLHCPLADTCDILKFTLLKRIDKNLARENNHAVKSCFYATIACSMALIQYKRISNDFSYNESIKKAAEFFLQAKLYKNRNNRPIIPKNNWNKDFRLLGYPILSQYDILYGLRFIAMAGYLHDSRTGEAFNLIISKQNSDGTWNLENNGIGMMYGNDRKAPLGEKNKWVTLNVLRLLKYAEDT